MPHRSWLCFLPSLISKSLLVQVQGFFFVTLEKNIGVWLWPGEVFEMHHKFHPSLGFASSVLQNVGWYWQAGKPVFKTVFYFFVISVALLLSTGFLAQFTLTRWIAVTALAQWLNVKNHPWIRGNYQADQIYQISHLFSHGICDFCRCFIAKHPGSSSLANFW